MAGNQAAQLCFREVLIWRPRVVGSGVVEADTEPAELDLEGDSAAAAGEAGEDGAVVGQHAGGDSPAHEGVLEGVHDVGSGDGAAGDAGQGEPGVVIEDVEDLHLGAVGQPPVGGVGLPAFVGLLGGEGPPRRPGRFWGCGVRKPRRVRIRQIVETAGIAVKSGGPGSTGLRSSGSDLGVRRARWLRIVSAPASSPCRARSLRNRMICSSTSTGTACGLECGRLE